MTLIALNTPERALFELLEKCAADGKRCPNWDGLRIAGIPKNTNPADLAKKGFAVVEVFSQNWRVVEIRTGPHAGKRTAECPRGGRSYKTINQVGTFNSAGRATAEHVTAGPVAEVREEVLGREALFPEVTEQDERDADLMAESMRKVGL